METNNATTHADQAEDLSLMALSQNLKNADPELQSLEEQEALRAFLQDFASERLQLKQETAREIGFELPQIG